MDGMERGENSGGSSFGAVEVGRSAPISPLGEEIFGENGSPYDGQPFEESNQSSASQDLSPKELRQVKEEPEEVMSREASEHGRTSFEPKRQFGGPAFYASLGLNKDESRKSDDV